MSASRSARSGWASCRTTSRPGRDPRRRWRSPPRRSKVLFTFAQEVGFLRFNIGAAVKVPPIKNTLAERIMSEADALLMIRQEPVLRNRVLLTVLYGGGLRISEVCGLRWRDLTARDEAGQATVFGKGGKTRAVLLSAATWKVLTALRGEAPADQPVFRSRKGGALDPSAVHRVVKAAAARAGLPGEVSAHWLRHAHASHSLDRGAPIHLVQATLGHASVATTGRYLHARPSESSARFLRGVGKHVRSGVRNYGASTISTCRSRPHHGSERPPGPADRRRLHPPRQRLQGAFREWVPIALVHA